MKKAAFSMTLPDNKGKMHWYLSHRFDPRALPLANGHYNRQKPESPQFVPPGKCLVLLTKKANALWVTSYPKARFTHHQWAGAWVNSLFCNHSGHMASMLIREAVAATRWWSENVWGMPVPSLGMITFVDARKLQQHSQKKEPGHCYLKAGFQHVGYTKEDHLDALQLLPEHMPESAMPVKATFSLFSSFLYQQEEGVEGYAIGS